MIKINLIGEPTAAAATKRKRPEISLGARQGDILLVAALLLSFLVIAFMWWQLSSRLDSLKSQEASLRREKEQLQQYIDKVDELEKKRATLKERINIINDLKARQHGPVRVMDEVSKALPDLVWLKKLELHGTDVKLEGLAMDENAVANYIANLDESPFFSEPILTDMRRGQKGTFEFTLNSTFKFNVGDPAAAQHSAGGAPGRS